MIPAMSPRAHRLLWLIIGAGTLARLIYAFATVGQAFDIESLRLVASTLDDHPLHVYSLVNSGDKLGAFVLYRWPYPPGYMPLASAALGLSKLGLPFHGTIQLFPIAADAAIAWLVQDFLGRRGATERVRLWAAALVAFGPAFFVVSGYHGQIDPVAILPAVAALHLWETSNSSRRAVYAGILIGLAASVKTIPAVMVLALLPSARDLREGASLVAAAGVVFLVIAAPFLVADGGDTVSAFRYVGAPGLGGLSMLVQPRLVKAFLLNEFSIKVTSATTTLHDHASTLVAVAMAGTGLFLLRFKARAVDAAVLVWLAVYVFNPNWFPQYMVWGLPFFLMAGHLVKVALVQAALVPVLLLFYLKPWHDTKLVFLHIGIMFCLWSAAVLAMLLVGRRIAASGSRRAVPAPA
jgi:uncharacterized membrane protein